MIVDDYFRVASALANDENTGDEELIDCLVESCPTLTREVIARVVERERPCFFLDSFHTIYWEEYLQPDTTTP